MKVLDLFAGLGGWSAVARERGHDVVRLDFNPDFDVEIVADILTVSAASLGGRGAFDLVLASPPCEAFSVLRIGRNWTVGGSPKTDAATTAYRIVERTLDLVRELAPAFWIVENPRAKLRVLPAMSGLARRTVSYCTLGEPFMKPTDLWGGFPPSLVLPEICRVERDRLETDEWGVAWTVDRSGNRCHVSAPRGSRTGVQGDGVTRGYIRSGAHPDTLMKSLVSSGRVVAPVGSSRNLAALRAMIPRRLAELVIVAAETDLALGRRSTLPPVERFDMAPTLFGQEAS